MQKLGRAGFLTAMLLGVVGCGSGGGGGGTAAFTLPDTPEDIAANGFAPGQLAGTYAVAETAVEADDPACEELENHTLEIEVNGNNVTVTDQDGNQFTGVVDPATGRVNATSDWSFDDDGGTTTITSLVIQVGGENGSTFVGIAEWQFTEPGFTCSGRTRFEANRLP